MVLGIWLGYEVTSSTDFVDVLYDMVRRMIRVAITLY